MGTSERFNIGAFLSFIFLAYVWFSSDAPSSVASIYFIQNNVHFIVKLIILFLGSITGGIGCIIGAWMGQVFFHLQ